MPCIAIAPPTVTCVRVIHKSRGVRCGPLLLRIHGTASNWRADTLLMRSARRSRNWSWAGFQGCLIKLLRSPARVLLHRLCRLQDSTDFNDCNKCRCISHVPPAEGGRWANIALLSSMVSCHASFVHDSYWLPRTSYVLTLRGRAIRLLSTQDTNKHHGMEPTTFRLSRFW